LIKVPENFQEEFTAMINSTAIKSQLSSFWKLTLFSQVSKLSRTSKHYFKIILPFLTRNKCEFEFSNFIRMKEIPENGLQ
jgi:hypothetical protein